MKYLVLAIAILFSSCSKPPSFENLLYIKGGYAQEVISEINLIEFNKSKSCEASLDDVIPALLFKSKDFVEKDGVVVAGKVTEKWLVQACGKELEYSATITGDPKGMVDTDVEKING